MDKWYPLYCNGCNLLIRAVKPCYYMMTSSNGNIFRVTGPLCGEFTGPGEFPTQRSVTRSFDVFFDLGLNKRLSKQQGSWWFETPSWSWWRHCNENGPPDPWRIMSRQTDWQPGISWTRLLKVQLNHWGRVTHIGVSKIIIIGSDNGLSPGRRQAIIWTDDGILLNGRWETKVSEIWIEIYTFSFKKMHLKYRLGNGSHVVSATMC